MGRIIFFYDITEIKALENMRKEFVSNVSHELKTPLTSIRGFVETLKNGALKDIEVALRFLDIIDVESLRLEGLIKDLLNLSHIEERKEYPFQETVDMTALTESLIRLLEPYSQSKEVSMCLKTKASIYYKGHEHWLKQLLLNLLSNSIEYNQVKGSVIVNLEETKDYLIISVKDTGIGIPQEEQERIFERFYKVDKSRSKNPNSTGLGLSIVKHIVELYSGSIEVHSQLNEGTEFRIKLPKVEGRTMPRKSFDQVLNELNYDVVELGALTIQVLEEAKDALENVNVNLAKQIVKRDEIIDRREMEIHEKWMNIIIREQPVASDLRFLVVVLKIITELERICDHGAKISKLVKKLKKRNVEKLPENIIDLFDLTIQVVKRVMRCYSSGNIEEAKAVYMEDDILDASYKSIIRWLKNEMSSNPEDIKEYMDYVFISKYF